MMPNSPDLSGGTPVTADKGTPAPGGGGGGGGAADQTSGGGGTQQKKQGSQRATPQWFARQVLKALGAPVTKSNVLFLVAWEQREGGHWEDSATYNPICTTLDAKGATSINGPGVKAYTSWQQGIQATADTIRLGYYTDILTDLKAGTANKNKTYSSLLTWSGGAYDSFSSVSGDYHPSGGGTTAGAGTPGGGTQGGDGTQFDVAAGNPHLSEQQLASQFGFVGDFLEKHPEVHKLVKQAVAHGWDDATFQAKLTQTPWWRQENITGVTNQIAATAAAYGLPLGHGVIGSWASKIVDGEATTNDFMRHAQDQAKSLFPYLNGWIQQGHTVDDYYDAYRQIAASTLGVNSAEIDLSKPMWREPLMQVDPKTGDRQPMSLSDWQSYVMKHPKYGFDQSPVATQQAADFAGQIGQALGAVG